MWIIISYSSSSYHHCQFQWHLPYNWDNILTIYLEENNTVRRDADEEESSHNDGLDGHCFEEPEYSCQKYNNGYFGIQNLVKFGRFLDLASGVHKSGKWKWHVSVIFRSQPVHSLGEKGVSHDDPACEDDQSRQEEADQALPTNPKLLIMMMVIIIMMIKLWHPKAVSKLIKYVLI